ncbi:hypothetical protein V5O48_005947 [Marasmius crinis-equi]|uniref:Uncharacterized protein n=1 Tax=Marasmius crinis-equi TaxID=585013 RepID=A0ABR3FKW9_9AGAR
MQRPQEPPAKRKRVDSSGMIEPDGFTKSATTAKPRSRVSTPVFQSAFGDKGEGTSKSAEDGSTKKRTTVKPRPRATAGAFQLNVGNGEVKDTLPTSKMGLKFVSTSKPTLPTTNPFSTKPISKGAHAKPIKDNPSKPLSQVKAPHLPITDSKPAYASRPATKPASKMKVLAPPVISPATASSSAETLNTSVKPLKTLAPPSFPLVDTTASADHKPIPHVLPLHPGTPPAKPLKTIGTTRVALATDISSDGAAELASILLQQHHIEEESDGHQEPERKRGLEVSPQKGRPYGANKFIRGGLAAQASSILSHLNTSLALWTKEISMHFSNPGPTSSSKLPKPDLRIQVMKILHVPVPATSFSISAIPGVAVCRLEVAPGITPFPLETPSQHARNAKYQYILTLLSFAARPSTPGIAVRNPALFHENQEVWAWKPWRTVSLDGWEDPLHGANSLVTKERNEDNLLEKKLFVSLRGKQAEGVTIERVALENVAYLCDRFVIVSR